MIDPDLVRVDLLKIKRKIFLSYPDGSLERDKFLEVSRKSGIAYLSTIIPEETATFVFSEYKHLINSRLFYIFYIFMSFSSFSFLFFILHISFPKVLFLEYWWIGFIFGFGFSIPSVQVIYKMYKDIKPFKNEYNALQKKIKELAEKEST